MLHPKTMQSVDQIFLSGDYVSTASMLGMQRSTQGSPVFSNDSDWRGAASLALLGSPELAISRLANETAIEPRFYLGVAHWMAGNDQEALQILQTVPLPHAQNLARIIAKPTINVLAQFARELELRDKKFNINVIGYGVKHSRSEPYGSIHNYYHPASPPDFYLSSVVEEREIPPDIQELPAPIFGATSDYDMMLHYSLDWLKLFDELVVAGPQEWGEVSALTGRPVSTYPKIYGLAEELPDLQSLQGKRDIDMFMSGTAIHPYHPEKSELFNSLLLIPGLNLKVVNGFIQKSMYDDLLARTKISFTYVRRPDEMPTRGMEALSMGCATIVQDTSVLTMYFGEDHGVYTYRDATDLPQVTKRILDNWEAIQPNIARGAALIRKNFLQYPISSQYLRFLTFLAAKPRPPRQMADKNLLIQKEPCLFRSTVYPVEPTFNKLILNLKRFRENVATGDMPKIHLDSCREVVMSVAMEMYPTARRARVSPMYSRGLLDESAKAYLRAIVKFPKNLMLRFNYVRSSLHLGDEATVVTALNVAEDTLAVPVDAWEVGPLDDAFPWDFFSQMFNYREYMDFCTATLTTGQDYRVDRARLIVASMHNYVAHYREPEKHFELATKLDPKFHHYQYFYSKYLASLQTDTGYQAAGRILESLVQGSVCFHESWKLLMQLSSNNLYSSTRIYELKAKLQTIDQFMTEAYPYEDLSSPFLQPKPLIPRLKPANTVELSHLL